MNSDPVAALGRAGVIAVIRGDSATHAAEIGESLANAGVRALEVAFTTPDTAGAVTMLRRRCARDVLVGTGTVTSVRRAERAIEAGADFLVSPGFDPELWRRMEDLAPIAIPGILTPSELSAATDAGARVVKLFPAGVLGVTYLQALRGPFPDVKLVPTGGITPASLGEWIRAGAFAVGIGGAFSPAARSSPKDAARQVEKPAQTALAALAAARGLEGDS